jgi:hypothetical protein
MLRAAPRLLLVALAVFGWAGFGARGTDAASARAGVGSAVEGTAAVAHAELAAQATQTLRAASEEPDGARRADAHTAARVAADARTPQGPHRSSGSQAWPEFAAAPTIGALRQITTTGLPAAPPSVRALAIPFDATAPPRTE